MGYAQVNDALQTYRDFVQKIDGVATESVLGRSTFQRIRKHRIPYRDNVMMI